MTTFFDIQTIYRGGDKTRSLFQYMDVDDNITTAGIGENLLLQGKIRPGIRRSEFPHA